MPLGLSEVPFLPMALNLEHNEHFKTRPSFDTLWPKMTPYDVQRYVYVFNQVDIDEDGKITGDQTRDLFLSWQLPRGLLINSFLNSFIL